MGTVDQARALLGDRQPKLHQFVEGGELRTGGLTVAMGERFIDDIEGMESPSIVETGAGASTLLFCALGAEVTSIAPDEGLWRRTREAAEQRDIDLSRLTAICDRSDIALPPLALSGKQIDLAFIDGEHGWPTVFVDFCYLNMMLRKGGLMYVDDVQNHAVRQLALLLRGQPEWEFEKLLSKMAVFRKNTDERFTGRPQPFINANTIR